MDDRVARCHLLAEVLAADGIMTSAERALLESHFDRYQLSMEERDQVLNARDPQSAVAALRAQPGAVRQEIVDGLVEAALADGKLTAGETLTVKRLTQALGLDD